VTRIQITTETMTYPDGAVSRQQTVVAGSVVKALTLYRMLAEVDARNLVGEALERIGGECE
jgi:uncharacterized protein YijF (DUF1287 family)